MNLFVLIIFFFDIWEVFVLIVNKGLKGKKIKYLFYKINIIFRNMICGIF